MTEEEIQKHKDNIDKLNQFQLAHMVRFAKVGHPYFDSSLPLYEYFMKRFKELGDMTPDISKRIGWS